MNTDILHTPGKDKQWNESFYFNWYDKKHGICCFTRIGLTPNTNQKNMFLFFLLPHRKKLGIRKTDNLEKPPSEEPLVLDVDDLRFIRKESEKEWHISFDGDLYDPYQDNDSAVRVQFDLDFSGLHPIFNYRDCPLSALQEKLSKNVASEHFEQYGKITGSLLIDDDTYEINALGERDHSWGVRHWTAPQRWVWLTCQFNKDFAFNITKLSVSEGDIDAGFIHINGKTIPIKKVLIDTVYSKHHEPLLFNLSMTTILDKVFDVQGSVKDKIHVPFEQNKTKSMMYENLAKYTYKNEIGYGIAEYLIKQ
jgi:hypothetical protein